MIKKFTCSYTNLIEKSRTLFENKELTSIKKIEFIDTIIKIYLDAKKALK